MKKMVETGVNLRKGIAMGTHDEMYGAKPKPTGSGPPKGPKPVKVGGKGY